MHIQQNKNKNFQPGWINQRSESETIPNVCIKQEKFPKKFN